jgi:hypothetical protein
VESGVQLGEFFCRSPEAERLFLESFTSTRERFRQSLDALRAGHLRLPNTDFDTGQATAWGEYSLADETYGELLDKLAHRQFADTPASLSTNIVAFYGNGDSSPGGTPGQQTRSASVRSQVALLKAACSCP